MRGLPRRSMLRLAWPIMIGRDAALARRCAPKGALPPLLSPGAARADNPRAAAQLVRGGTPRE